MITVQEYGEWHENPPFEDMDFERARRYREVFLSGRLPGVVMLECYPAELRTLTEVSNAAGILW